MRCIECEEIELARVRDLRPGQTLPIPHAALDGFPAGKSRRDLTRRRLLQWGVAGFASVYGVQQLGFEQVMEALAAAHDAPTDKCLVVLYLAGGNDGLNVVLPNGAIADKKDYDAYTAARPELHRAVGPTGVDTNPLTGPFAQVGSKALSNNHPLAFSNVAVSKNGGGDNQRARFKFTGTGGDAFGLDTLYGDGTGGTGSDLAIMPAVDAKKFSLSHFDNSDIWFAATNEQSVKTGWLGRWIDRNGEPDNPLQAISLDTALSKTIRTANKPVCAIPSLPMTGFALTTNGYGGVNSNPATPRPQDITVNLNPRIDALAFQNGNPYLGRSRSTYGLAVETYQRSKDAGLPAGAGYPNSSTLSTKLRTAAHLLAAGLGTRIITIHWGGFDTHTGQLASQDKQLAELSWALGAFRADLQRLGIEQKVATLVWSEFGRRVKENGADDLAGTDHGAGGLMMAMGSGVRGGFAADWPGCEMTEVLSGNLKVATDYRSVYMAVLEEWLGGDDPRSLIDGTVDPLIRGDGRTGRQLFKP